MMHLAIEMIYSKAGNNLFKRRYFPEHKIKMAPKKKPDRFDNCRLDQTSPKFT